MSRAEQYDQDQCDSAKSDEQKAAAELHYANKAKRGVDWSKVPEVITDQELWQFTVDAHNEI